MNFGQGYSQHNYMLEMKMIKLEMQLDMTNSKLDHICSLLDNTMSFNISKAYQTGYNDAINNIQNYNTNHNMNYDTNQNMNYDTNQNVNQNTNQNKKSRHRNKRKNKNIVTSEKSEDCNKQDNVIFINLDNQENAIDTTNVQNASNTDTDKNNDTTDFDKINPLAVIMGMMMVNKHNSKKKNEHNKQENAKGETETESETESEKNDDADDMDDVNDNFHEFTDKIVTINDLVELSKKIEENEDSDSMKYPINKDVLKKLVVPLEKLNNMVGLHDIKNSTLNMIIYYLQEFEKRNKHILHTVISGPPGCGKTECGKIIAEIYAALGVIKSNKFTLVKRTDLIGEYLGHTAHKTQRIIDNATAGGGGVLFIDEAYSLGSNGNSNSSDTYSKECIDTLNQNLTENKKKLIVIIAGYEDELEKSFFSYNPGLKRRFPFRYNISGYTTDELREIFTKMVHKSKWKLASDVNKEYLITFFDITCKSLDNLENYGGDLENIFTQCKFAHSRRVFGLHPKNRKIISKDDLEVGFQTWKNMKNNIKGKLSTEWKNMFT